MLFNRKKQLTVEQFFGLNLKQEHFDIDELLALVDLQQYVASSKAVIKLKQANSNKAMIVTIAKRQQALKLLRNLLNSELLPYDEYFYIKKVNTGSEHDRLYSAEDKLLQYAYVIAMGKTWNWLENENPAAILKGIRERNTSQHSRFDRYWEILGDQTGEYIRKFKKGEVGTKPD
ncbi:MAG TPA: hypothetical protein ENJ60_14125 [Aeromonadales bacterium]|nr:hypothetical protein [Aeromonadales bacterium]